MVTCKAKTANVYCQEKAGKRTLDKRMELRIIEKSAPAHFSCRKELLHSFPVSSIEVVSIMRIKKNYIHTIYASYVGYITQAIVNNFAPLLFLTFSRQFGLTLDKITLITTINFAVQLFVDLLSANWLTVSATGSVLSAPMFLPRQVWRDYACFLLFCPMLMPASCFLCFYMLSAAA